jgi:DAK2 domain fusion protein YloV
MLIAGAQTLDLHKPEVNALNVFPVPDGDTGTNMTMTLQSVIAEMQQLNADADLSAVGQALSTGSLMGARGNSGVILSQLFRGLAQGLTGKRSINTREFAQSLQRGVDTVYKAVLRPTEGTILTVARESAHAALEAANKQSDFAAVMAAVLDQAKKTLEKTPTMLKVLKQAGVVDAGGKGLVYIFEGFLAVLEGRQVELNVPAQPVEVSAKASGLKEHVHLDTEDIKFQYCTEFILRGPADREALRSFYADMGDSVLVIGEGDVTKVHVHTNSPGRALDKAQEYGELSRIKIDNMKEQHRNLNFDAEEVAGAEVEAEPAAVEVKPLGVVAISSGNGFKDIFLSMGVDQVVSGGQTKNPSTEDIWEAVKQVPAETVAILPNNKNIIMAAEQVAQLAGDRQRIIVLPTTTVPEGLAAMLAYESQPIDGRTVDDIAAAMKAAYRYVKTGSVTYAVRDSHGLGVDAKAGDIIALSGKEIVASGPDLNQVAAALIDGMLEDVELVTIYSGEGVSLDQANSLKDRVMENHPDIEIEVHEGGQQVYYYIISAE